MAKARRIKTGWRRSVRFERVCPASRSLRPRLPEPGKCSALPVSLWRREGTKMKINSKDFRVRPGKKFELKEWPTKVKPFFKSKKQYQKLLEEHVEQL